MAKKPSHVPRDHHFLPAFYLRRWGNAEGNLVQFSIPFETKVVAKPKHSKATGFVRDLYRFLHVDDTSTQQVERKLFGPIDDRGAKALEILESTEQLLEPHHRANWGNLVFSLELRMPEDIETLRSNWKEFIYIWHQNQGANLSYAFDPPEGIAPQEDAQKEHSMFVSLYNILMFSGKNFSRLHWEFLDLSTSRLPLLTSDRPIVRTYFLRGKKSFLALPIGPHRLFVARGPSRHPFFEFSSASQLVARVNCTITRNAVRFVYGTDDRMLKFIKSRMGSSYYTRLIEALPEYFLSGPRNFAPPNAAKFDIVGGAKGK